MEIIASPAGGSASGCNAGSNSSPVMLFFLIALILALVVRTRKIVNT